MAATRQHRSAPALVSGLPLALLATGTAAQGIGPPRGVLETFVLFWGFCGIAAGAMLLVAVALDQRRAYRFVAGGLVFVATAYALSAVACFFLVTEAGASKITGTVGFAVLAIVGRYVFRAQRGWRLGGYGLIAASSSVLLLIPNAYWEMPLVSFTRIVYEDNLVGDDTGQVLRTSYGYGGRLALADGRLLIQTQHIPERPRYRGQSERVTYANGAAVALEPVTSSEPGTWFEIQHYDWAYVEGVQRNGQRARYVLALSEERVPIYRRGIRTLGFLVDESAGLANADIVIGLMREDYSSWSNEPGRSDPGNEYHWASTLIESSALDLQSPAFLDRAYADGVTSSALMGVWPLGLSPVARDSRGNTILHIAASRCDANLLRFLENTSIDIELRNLNGRTAGEIVRARAGEDPGRCAGALRYFEEELAAIE